jgi:predicted  nucleic acid-binding Zn-ribbon protein
MSDERLFRLYKLHQVDEKLLAIKARAEHLDVGKRELALAKKLATDNADLLAEAKATKQKLAELTLKEDQANEKLEKFQKQLYDGSITSSREIAHLQDEIEMLEMLVVTTDDERKALAASSKESSAAAAEIEEKISKLKEQAVKKRSHAEKEHAELQELFKQTGATRASKESEVEKELITAYNNARKRTGNTGLALITAKQDCGSCGIDIPEKVREVVRDGKTTPCQSCGRVLFIHAPGELD